MNKKLKSLKLNLNRRTERWDRLEAIAISLGRQDIYTQELLDAMDDNSEFDDAMSERFLAF